MMCYDKNTLTWNAASFIYNEISDEPEKGNQNTTWFCAAQ